MKTTVILASGASLTDEQVCQVYNSDKVDEVLAVSNVGITKAPWADFLVSYDSAWWIAHPEALQFQGRKFCSREYNTVEKFDIKSLGIKTFLNSGLFAMFIAREICKTKRIILLGFDMHRRNGQHFFGKHERIYNNQPLKNTDEKLFKIHINQFNLFEGCEVINCTPDSDLKRFTQARLKDII